MRPEILNPIFAQTTTLSGVGPKRAQSIARAVGRDDAISTRILDVLFHLPHNVIDRRFRPKIANLVEDTIATVQVRVGRHDIPKLKNLPYRVHCYDDTGELVLVFFGARGTYLEKQLPEGETRFISGRVAAYGGTMQMVHPDHIVDEAGLASLPLIEPVYGLSAGLSGRVLGTIIRDGLKFLPSVPEWLNPTLLKKRGWPDFSTALHQLHEPPDPETVQPTAPGFQRLAYDELLAGQLALALVRRRMTRAKGQSIVGDGRFTSKIYDALPFALTAAQQQAVAEISDDLKNSDKMLRLLQGDVGSGKTIVALLAMAISVEANKQAVLMAPTEILARQHYDSIAPLCTAAGLRVDVLTGRDKGKSRQNILDRLKSGDIDILIATHAAFQDDVAFKNLGFAVVDEQHRFGVHQRLALAEKGQHADLLVMTATPIPRSLVLAYFGDMDVSRLAEKPAGRTPIETRAMPLERLNAVIEGLRRALDDHAQVYWVCPLVEESETLDITPADVRFSALKDRFGDQVGLVHGRMKAREKTEAMAAFLQGATRILVATTVIEVGVDVPNATIMIIEHAERFGLAQLHQLRGRVGRGAKKSSCLLLYKAPLSANARARIDIMRETEDGFRIAEEDLRLRGEGDLLGTRQSGMPGFRIARMEYHADLLETARQDARLSLEQDSDLVKKRGRSLRILLHLFERAEAVKLLKSG